MGAGSLAAYGWGVSQYGRGSRASTIAFNSLTAAQLLHMLSARSEQQSIFTAERPANNLLLFGAMTGGLALQLATLLIPNVRRFLRNAPLSAADGIVSLLGAGLPFLINEATKSRAPLGLPDASGQATGGWDGPSTAPSEHAESKMSAEGTAEASTSSPKLRSLIRSKAGSLLPAVIPRGPETLRWRRDQTS